MSKVFGAPEQAKIKQIISEGVTVMQEIEDLSEGLNDTIKAVAEELEVKPSIIKKAIKIAQKGDWDRVFHEFDDLETIVDISGHAIRQDDYNSQNPNRNTEND
jgi:predicted regulator of amino acid metabolism with ACT domain